MSTRITHRRFIPNHVNRQPLPNHYKTTGKPLSNHQKLDNNYPSSSHFSNAPTHHNSNNNNNNNTNYLSPNDISDADIEAQSPLSQKYKKSKRYPMPASTQNYKTNTRHMNNHNIRYRQHQHSKKQMSTQHTNDNNNAHTSNYTNEHGHKTPPQSKKKKLKRKIAISTALFLFAFGFYYYYGDYLTFRSLRDHHHVFIEFIDEYPVLSPLIYVITVMIVVGLTIPGATVLSMAGGLFFIQPYASIYAWFGCGSGAILCFIFVRFLCEDCFKNMIRSHSDWFAWFESGIKNNELLYLIYVRYMIVIPFWFVNVAAALLGAKFNNFFISTFIATIPGSLLYTTAGRGLANAFEYYDDDITTFMLLKQVLWSRDIQYCLLLLFCCIFIPFVLKKYKSDYFKKFAFNDDDNDENSINNNSEFQYKKFNDFTDSSDSEDCRNSGKSKFL